MNIEAASENGGECSQRIWLGQDHTGHHDRAENLDVALERHIRILRPQDAHGHEGQQCGNPRIPAESCPPIEAAAGQDPNSDDGQQAEEQTIDQAALCRITAAGRKGHAPDLKPHANWSRSYNHVPERRPEQRLGYSISTLPVGAKRKKDQDGAEQEG